MRAASSAPTRRAVSSRSRACFSGNWRITNTATTAATNPIFASVKPTFAFASCTAKSQAQIMPAPAPTA